MNRDELLDFHEEFTGRMFDICRRKNQDYAGGAGDPFANFRRVEALGVCGTEQGFLVRMTDKMSRLATLLTPGAEAQVKDESIEDTLIDLANYSLLLAAYRAGKEPAPASLRSGGVVPPGPPVPVHPNCRCVVELTDEEQDLVNDHIDGTKTINVKISGVEMSPGMAEEIAEAVARVASATPIVVAAHAADETFEDDGHPLASYGRCPNRDENGRCCVCNATDFGAICTYRGA